MPALHRCLQVCLLGLALTALSAGCRSTSPARRAAEEWGRGPASWLLLGDERRELASIRDATDFEAFHQRFWMRRDPDSSHSNNAAADLYFARVADADQLYGQSGLRGSLSDRGGALILLGPPNILRHRQKRVPAQAGRSNAQGPRPTIRITEEVWIYFTQDLPPNLTRLIRDTEGPLPDIALTFVLQEDGARMTQGRDYLRLAKSAWLATESPSS